MAKRLGMAFIKVGSTTAIKDQVSSHVTVLLLEDGANRVVSAQPLDDGRVCVELTSGRAKHTNKPIKGHCGSVVPGKSIKGFCIGPGERGFDLKQGDLVDFSFLENISKVDVQARSKGKGFAGVIKRWNFSSCGMTHGVSKAHRKPGSTGQCQDPGRVFPGKKMPGQMGGGNITALGLRILKIDLEKQALLVVGAVPGPNGARVVVWPSARGPKEERSK
jgi:large subunit ribosomal protein L3